MIVPFPGRQTRYKLTDGHATTGGKDEMETRFAVSQIDTSRPHPARYDAYPGGKDNYPADRGAIR